MNHFFHTIKFKIILAFGVCVTLTAAIGLFGVFGISRLNSNMSDAYSSNTVPIAQLSDIRAAQLDIRAKLRRLQATRNADDVAKTLPGIQANVEMINKAWTDYYPASISSDKEHRIADKINAALSEFKFQTTDAVAALKESNFDAAADLISRSANVSDSLTNDLGADATLHLVQAKQFSDDSGSTFRAILWIAIALIGFGVMVAAGASLYLLRAISNPLKKAVDVANQIASGRLENDIQITSRDEFGQLLEALKRMDQQLSNTIRGIKGS
ncbi:HAMP domain-containing protein, partial [Paraburkholderia madseniana]